MMMGEAKRGMAMGTEDFSFSFPITPSHSPIDSPPLWSLSPAASPGYRLPRKSSSFLEAGAGLINIRRLRFMGAESDTQDEGDHENKDEEEKMGMMWEAWNEELSKHRRQIMMDLHTNKALPKSTAAAIATTASPSNNVIKSSIKKKGSVLVIVKVLKKLFLLHQSASKKRSR